MARASKKDHLVETAARMFCANGYRSTGIDSILAEAGVAKMTLYGNFKTKEDLILASLEVLDRQGYEWIEKEVTAVAQSPLESLKKLMTVIEIFLFHSPFNGCPFIRASTEYPELGHEIHMFAQSHKGKLNDFFRKLCTQAKLKNPKQLANYIQLIMEGTMAMVQLTGERKWVSSADSQLKMLLDFHS